MGTADALPNGVGWGRNLLPIAQSEVALVRDRLALVAGPGVFLVAGLAGLGMAGHFFAYPDGFAKPIILFIEAFMLLTIAATLPVLVAGPPRRRPEP